MKKYLNRKNICLTILILIIIAGIITIGVMGFNKSQEYTAGTRIEAYIPQGYDKQDIINIAKESFSNKEILFLEVEKLNQVAGIKVSTYTDDELENFKSKISEKYEIDKENLELYEVSIPATKITTIIEPYTLPILLVTILSLIYILIKNFKSNDVIKNVLKVLGILVIALGLYFSLIALFRLPFTMFTMPLALIIYVIVLLVTVNNIRK